MSRRLLRGTPLSLIASASCTSKPLYFDVSMRRMPQSRSAYRTVSWENPPICDVPQRQETDKIVWLFTTYCGRDIHRDVTGKTRLIQNTNDSMETVKFGSPNLREKQGSRFPQFSFRTFGGTFFF